jgi:hypothetical protein
MTADDTEGAPRAQEKSQQDWRFHREKPGAADQVIPRLKSAPRGGGLRLVGRRSKTWGERAKEGNAATVSFARSRSHRLGYFEAARHVASVAR